MGSALIVLPSCSLLIDTNPDGIIDNTGGQARGTGIVAGSHGKVNSNNVGAAGTVGGITSLGSSAGASAYLVTGGQTTIAGTSGNGGIVTAGGGQSGATLTCPSSGGPAMVKMPEGYCIDSTEVTRTQYAAWLKTLSADAINNQDAATCGGNVAFEADSTCMAGSSVCALGCDNHPQVCVDWCDAVAYCRGVGKRLCGKIGGGPNAFGDYADATKSQWYNACSSGGTQIYPYGNTYQSTYCNGAEYGAGTTTNVGFLVKCKAPVPYGGVSDLSGNVHEWEDSCDGATCRVRGGSYYGARGSDVQANVSCAWGNSTLARNTAGFSTGFRCCYP